jgi:hypothetical protein
VDALAGFDVRTLYMVGADQARGRFPGDRSIDQPGRPEVEIGMLVEMINCKLWLEGDGDKIHDCRYPSRV